MHQSALSFIFVVVALVPHNLAVIDTRLYWPSRGPRVRRSAGGGGGQATAPPWATTTASPSSPESTTTWASVEDPVAFVTNYLANDFERKASQVCNRAVLASWELVLDLASKEKEQNHVSLAKKNKKTHFPCTVRSSIILTKFLEIS